MKKIMLLAAVCAAFASCSKETASPAGNPEGELVTICVNAGGDSGTKVIGALNSDKGIDFTWESDDQIKVTRGGESSNFTLKSGAGTASAVFEGTMPGSGETFDVQFPVDEPDLSSQDYQANALPHNKMMATATGCTLGSTVTLSPSYAALRLNLYGTNQTVSMIVVTNISSSENPQPSYTLTCGNSGVTVGADTDNATAFFIVIPAGMYKFTANVYNTPKVIGTFTPTNEQTFTAGKVKNMPAKEVKEESCLPSGTRITMADGSFKKVEDIVEGDMIRTFDHEAGVISSAKVCLAMQEEGQRLPLSLHFASGNTLTIAGQHGLLEKATRKYTLIHQNNVQSYVGKSFYNAQSGSWDKLLNYEVGSAPVDRYAIYSAKHLNVIAENMLTVEDDVDHILNIYELDENLKADADQLAADIAKYGLMDVERDYPECIRHKQILEDLGCQYIYIALGKGLISLSVVDERIAYWRGL